MRDLKTVIVGFDGSADSGEALDTDLVVVGSHGLGSVARFVWGSLSARGATHSPANALIVRRW